MCQTEFQFLQVKKHLRSPCFSCVYNRSQGTGEAQCAVRLHEGLATLINRPGWEEILN